MLRSLITCAGVTLIGASAFAQSNAHSMLRPVTSTVKDAGVYHLATGTWTRHADTANGTIAGKDCIYSNTCPTGYYSGLFRKEYVADEGRIPGPNGPVLCDTGTSPAGRLSTNKGCFCSYTVTGFQVAYCSGLPGFGNVDINVGFSSAYTACAVPNPLPKAAGTFDLTGLPGAGLSVQGCWLVTIDTVSFPINADGASCTWTGTDVATNHLFGWTFQNQTTVLNTGTSYVGPLIAGNGGNVLFVPNPSCSMVDNTRWDTLTCAGQGGGPDKWPNNTTEDGWGMDTQDRFRSDTTQVGGQVSPPSGPGCYFFGGNPVGSFHLKLFANTGCVTQPGTDICRPGIDFTSPPCPCNNPPTTVGAGCNGLSPGAVPTGGAKLTSSGTSSLSGTTPGVNTLKFTVTGLPTNATESCYLIQGPTLSLPTVLVFGQGLRCVNGQLKRLQLHGNSPGTSSWPAPGDFSPTIQARSAALGDPLSAGTTRHYFIQYRGSNIPPPCVFPTNFNCSQAQTIVWQL